MREHSFDEDRFLNAKAGEAWPRPYGACLQASPCRGGAMPRPPCLPLEGKVSAKRTDDVKPLLMQAARISKKQESALLPLKGSRALYMWENYSATALMPSMMMAK